MTLVLPDPPSVYEVWFRPGHDRNARWGRVPGVFRTLPFAESEIAAARVPGKWRIMAVSLPVPERILIEYRTPAGWKRTGAIPFPRGCELLATCPRPERWRLHEDINEWACSYGVDGFRTDLLPWRV